MKVSPSRRLVFIGLALVGLTLTVEALSHATYRVVTGRWFSRADLSMRLQRVPGYDLMPDRGVAGPQDLQGDVLHPYLGWVLDPTVRDTVSSHGFVSDPFEKTSPDQLRVALFGGSVAGMTAPALSSALTTALGDTDAGSRVPRRVSVITLAFGGGKQPQQLLTLAYLRSLGARFDIVVNLDGFNDVVLPIAENVPAGTFPFYPRWWKERVSGLAEPGAVRQAGVLELYGDARRALADRFSRSSARHFATTGVAWLLVDRIIERQYAKQEEALRAVLAGHGGFLRSGPRVEWTRDEVLAESVAVWARASVDMHALASSAGTEYFHFLQPNQYYENSKPLSPEERRSAFAPEGSYGAAARQGYPLLVQAGRSLVEAGVPFVDLTGIFSNAQETLYIDDCCHLNAEGTRRLAERIASVIADRLGAVSRKRGDR